MSKEPGRRCYMSFLPDSGEFELVFDGMSDSDVEAARKTAGDRYLSVTIKKTEAIRMLQAIAAGLLIDATGEAPPPPEELVM